VKNQGTDKVESRSSGGHRRIRTMKARGQGVKMVAQCFFFNMPTQTATTALWVHLFDPQVTLTQNKHSSVKRPK